MAVLKGNPFPDARPRFLRQMSKATGLALGAKLRITAPYLKLSKDQVLRLVKGFPVELTFSCLAPKGLRHCGACSKCEERLGATPRSRPS